MCGIIGILAKGPVNQSIYDGLTVVQHRGQDAAGILTSDGRHVYLRKDNGLVSMPAASCPRCCTTVSPS